MQRLAVNCLLAQHYPHFISDYALLADSHLLTILQIACDYFELGRGILVAIIDLITDYPCFKLKIIFIHSIFT